jgi:hypothetical protein
MLEELAAINPTKRLGTPEAAQHPQEKVTLKHWATLLVADLAVFISTVDMSVVNAVLLHR